MKKRNGGFTLVEILIVVVILGILAAIVIPQFTEASNDARESALASDLQTVRSQIELYKVQHRGRLPGLDANGQFDGQLLVDLMTMKSDANGKVYRGTGPTEEYEYGPYLTRMPANPFAAEARAALTKGGPGGPPHFHDREL